jgi:hypothetical protein
MLRCPWSKSSAGRSSPGVFGPDGTNGTARTEQQAGLAFSKFWTGNLTLIYGAVDERPCPSGRVDAAVGLIGPGTNHVCTNKKKER